MHPPPPPSLTGLSRIALAPTLLVGDGLLDPALVAALAALDPTAFDHARDARTGTSVELAASDHPAAGDLLVRLGALLGVSTEGALLRWRVYGDGEGHPAHLDDYEVDGRRLAATAIVTLGEPERGGETFFPCAWPEPVAVGHRTGRVAVWLDVGADGRPDPSSEHAGLPVGGRKVTAALFVYLAPAEIPPFVRRLRAVAHGVAPPGVRIGGPSLHVIAAPEAPETTGWLRSAAAERGLGFRVLDPRRADWLAVGPLAPGHLLYRAGTAPLDHRLEASLIGPGVGHVHRDPDGAIRPAWHDLALARAGLPMPRRVPAVSADPERLAGEVARLGGFPVVVRFAGGSGGVGVVRCDSLPALASLVEWALSLGHAPDVLTYIAEGEVWRAIVVGDRCVAAYPNPVVEGDFRSGAPVDPTAYARPWPEGLDALALAAAVAVGARVAGVDVIALPTGRMYVLEANAPCYWGHAQEHGADVAGAIVDLLLALADG